MNCSPTLTAEEFKTIHNALWELDCVIERTEGVINQELFNKLYTVSKTIREGLKGAYEQDNRAFETKNDHYEMVKQEQGLRTIWSIYEVEDLFQQHAYPGAREICYRDHWGDKPVYETIQGNTWVDLYAAADRCIQRSGDQHHVFIEAFYTVEGQPHQLRLTTGS